MIRYNKSVIDWILEQQLLSLDPVNNCILLLSAKHAALKRKSKDRLARNQNNVSIQQFFSYIMARTS
jgi:hypothetical protein